jgi:flagellar motor switch/type III secretory pathway protein FliN
MPELSPSIVSEVLAACQAGASEAAAALSRTLDAELKLTVGEPSTLSASTLPEELNSPGLAVVLTIGGNGLLFVLPESTGLLPDWYAAPDPTGQSKLTTLAQELGMCFLPDNYMPESYKTTRANNLADAIRSAKLVDDAAMIPLALSKNDGKQGTALLIWPVTNPGAVISAVSPKQETKPQSDVSSESQTEVKATPQPKAESPRRRTGKREFPPYTRSLLRVRVPVVVTLAQKKQTLGRILDIGPGQILQFDKSCEETLDLEAGNCKIAAGEAVKVGDKFGLRILSIVPPEERFLPVKK